MDYLNQTIRWFSELLWPPRCVGCNTLGSDLCIPCLRTIVPLSTQKCPACQRPNMYGVPCPGCRERTHVDSIVAIARIEHVLETAIYALKYRGMRRLAIILGDWAAQMVGSRQGTATLFGTNPLIIPVPLHPSRLRERDYNQATLLARRLAAASAMPMDDAALIRERHTSSQVKTHSRIERLDNMRGAFAVMRPDVVADRDIILIDDVCTTGATLEDCARALKEAGSRTVSAIVLAHG